MKPKALLFDVFGTVVDWRSGIARDLAIHFQTHPSNTDPESVADAWRTEYHECIYIACGNSFLADETRSLRRRLQSFRRLQLRVRGRMPQSLGEHFEIVEAIEAGDADQADRNSRQHVMIQGERFHDLLVHMEQGG